MRGRQKSGLFGACMGVGRNIGGRLLYNLFRALSAIGSSSSLLRLRWPRLPVGWANASNWLSGELTFLLFSTRRKPRSLHRASLHVWNRSAIEADRAFLRM